MEKKITIKTKDGIKLVGLWRCVHKKSAKAVMLAHGITVDKEEEGMFSQLAEILAKKEEIASFRFDFRGHGESRGRQEDMTISGEIKDLTAVYLEVQKKGFKRIGIVGSSFGGGITVLTAKEFGEDVKTICLFNTVLNFKNTFINPFLPWLKNDITRMKNELKNQGRTYIPVENPHRIGRQLFEEMEKIEPYRHLGNIRASVLIIHGDSDSYVPYKYSVKYLDSFKDWKKLLTIQGADHGFSGERAEEYKKQAYRATLEFFRKFL